MRFRPCIDIHNGAVKQIVGGSLKDQGDQVIENFRSDQDAAYYARMYREDDLPGVARVKDVLGGDHLQIECRSHGKPSLRFFLALLPDLVNGAHVVEAHLGNPVSYTHLRAHET